MTENEREQLDLLNMIHDKVSLLSGGYFYCIDNDKATILNEFGCEVISGDANSLLKVGDYICMPDADNKKYVNIYNFKSNRKKKVLAEDYTFNDRLRALDKYIAVISYNGITILNENLAIIADIPECRNIRVSKVSETSLWFSYYSNLVWLNGLIDKQNDVLVYYGICKIQEGIEVVATEYTKKGFSVNRSTCDFYKYKPIKNGIIYGDKAYQDIVKSDNNINGMLFAYELGPHENKCMGLITDENVEVIPAIYKNIEYLGDYNYKITYEGNIFEDMAFIYNIKTKARSLDYNSDNIIIHQTLPLTIIKKKDQTVILDYMGNLFDIKDIAKYFNCSYSLDNNTILKFEFEYGSKYVDNRLTPITNIHSIASLSKNKWVRLSN